MSRSLKFARLLAAELRDSSVIPHYEGFLSVRGRLDVGGFIASIEVIVPQRFRIFKKYPPIVVCSEPWVKQGADWHNKESLCWVIPDEWKDAMNWKGKPVARILAEGLAWLIKEVRCLLSRHYYAHLEGLECWSPEWPAWGHGVAGIREYKRTKNGAPTGAGPALQ
jgi:hypothetical protein